MKFKNLFSLVLLMTLTWTLQAQQRKCEMNIELLSPSEGAVIQAFAQYNLTVKITNNGPNTLKIGDTLFYNIPPIPAISYRIFVLQDSIPANTTANINLSQLSNMNQNELDETTDFYVKVFSNPEGTGIYRDTFLTNNMDVNTITLKPCGINGGGGTAIHNVNGQTLNFTLYPNPAANSIRLKTEDLKVKNILITDISGRIVISKNVPFNTEMELDITALPGGMYFLRVDTDKGMAASKFIKE